MKMMFLLSLMCLTFLSIGSSRIAKHTFVIGENQFLLDGKPFQIISGEMHFARIPREYWRDRLRMARAMGLNTIATYIFWNYHEPEKGRFLFEGNADVATFVKIAREEGLWVIVRPSPYACAEWEFGGYPWWLLKEQGLKVRSKDPRFLDLSRRYFNELGKQLAPLQITRGGNIIMVQLENEYGSYGDDKEYLGINEDIIRNAGFDVPLYTCDGPTQMPRGYLPGLLPAVNGLDDVAEVKKLINTYHHRGPYFIAEWYPAWFDSWGVEHHVVPAENYVRKLEEILSAGLSINMYMVHGGTTRGFMNGANFDTGLPFLPQTSSYDYDAPIDEAGNATPKFLAFRKVIQEHLGPGVALPDVPPKKKSMAIPAFPLTQAAEVFANLPEPVVADRPMSFEDINQGYGYVLYRCTVPGPQKGKLRIEHLRDYGLVFLNGKRVAVLDRRQNQESAIVDLPAGDVTLDIFVENLGRINYGPYLNDNRKGITEKVMLDQNELKGWKMYRFPFDDFSKLRFADGTISSGPVVRRGTFILTTVADTYLDMRDWRKGCVWVNGRNVGRYWNVGPQQTLYVPGPWLKPGENTIEVFEQIEDHQATIEGLGEPILDELGNPVVTVKGWFDRAKDACMVNLAVKGLKTDIRYTLDGSEPSATSDLFSTDLSLLHPVKIGVRAVRNGALSEVISYVDVHPSMSTGKQITLAFPFSPRYGAGGEGALVDGFKGSANSGDGFWQGFEGSDLDALIDLGEIKEINHLSAGFLQDTRSWIFFPTAVEYSVSDDGIHFVSLGKMVEPVASGPQEVSVKEFSRDLHAVKARFVKIHANNVGVCPAWHPGKGGKAWLFADEIVVE